MAVPFDFQLLPPHCLTHTRYFTYLGASMNFYEMLGIVLVTIFLVTCLFVTLTSIRNRIANGVKHL